MCKIYSSCNLVEFSFNKGRFIGLSPKSYHAVCDSGATKSGHKGVHHSEAKKLTNDIYASCLYENRVVNVISRELRRNEKQQMIYSETNKLGLNPIFKKFRVQDDKISCLPLCKNGKIL